MHIQINTQLILTQMGKSYNRKSYKVYGITTKQVIHSGGGSNAGHCALDPNHIDSTRVGLVVEGKWYTNGNCITDDTLSTHISGWRDCGVQLYDHPTLGQVYLVFNPLYQEALPVPLSATIPSLQPPSAPQPPASSPTTERLPHPFQ